MTAPALSGRGTPTALTARLTTEAVALSARATTVWGIALVGPALAVLAGCVLLFGDGRWLALPRALPVAGLALALVSGVPLAWWIRRRAASLRSLPSLAGVIEQEQALRAGSLRGALEVATTGPLGARAAQDVAARLTPTRLAPRLAQHWTRWQQGALAVLSVALLGLLLAARRYPDGWRATMHPVQAWQGTLLPALAFDRLPGSVPRGMPLTVRIQASGRRQIMVSRRAEGEAWRDTTLTVTATDGEARLALGPVRSPVTLRVNDGRARELTAVIGVNERGWIGDITLFAEYPAYLGRSNEVLEAVSPVRVPRGTRVRVSARLRGGVATASLSDGQQTAPLAPIPGDASNAADGLPVRGLVTLDHDSRWGWQATTGAHASGATLAPELPDSLLFTVIPDRSPEVLIAAPNTEATITATGTVGVLVRAADDHGLGAIALAVWREPASASAAARAAMPRQRLAVAEPQVPFFEGGVTVPLDGRGLEPGDRLHLIAYATDDSPWHQQTASREVVLRVPSMTEQRELARSMADSLAQQAQQMAQQEKRLQQSTADAARSRDLKGDARAADQNGTGKPNASKAAMSFQQAERARQMAKDQQEMSARIDSLRQNAKALEDRLKGANALDTAMANRMRDIQKMLREAMTPEMQKQLEALNKSADRLSGTEAQQSMEQLAEQQRQLRQQLEKSAEMLKRAALEGAMSTLRDEAKDVADAQRRLAEQLQQQAQQNGKTADGQRAPDARSTPPEDPKALAERTKALKAEIDRLAKRLEENGAKPGASQTRAAQPMVDQASQAMEKAAAEKAAADKAAAEKAAEAAKADGSKGDPSKSDPTKSDPTKSASGKSDPSKGDPSKGDPSKGDPTKMNAAQAQGEQGAPQPGKSGQQGQQAGGGSSGGGGGSQQAAQASEAMRKAAQQLANAKDAQVNAWKGELSDQLDQSINETQQLARQQAELAKRMQQGGDGQSMQGEQGALQQGVQQAAERLEQAGRTSSLLSQRSQKAMADAQRRVQQATQQMGQAGQPGANDAAQNAMKDATEALNQALSSLVRDRERVNGAQSASGFQEMMQQMKELAQKQGQLNGQMQGLNGAQGDGARQQARTLARQQRDVARALTDVSDADQSGRTDALAKEAQALAQQIERNGLDPSVAARQQQLYRRLLDAGRFMEQEERDDQGPREAKAGSGTGSTTKASGPTSGKAASKFAPPSWNDLRGLGAEDRRLVIEYFRRLNGTPPG